MKFVVKVLCLCVCLCLSWSAFGGGEVPWPLSAQRIMSAENSQGLWYSNIEGDRSLYNVEVIQSTELWLWVRVSKLEFKTLKVLAQGEGYYWYPEKDGVVDPLTSEMGAYVHMTPVEDAAVGHFLRVVELWGGFGPMLGFSKFLEGEPETGAYGLGYRIGKTPLNCQPTFSTVPAEGGDGTEVTFKTEVKCRLDFRANNVAGSAWQEYDSYLTGFNE